MVCLHCKARDRLDTMVKRSYHPFLALCNGLVIKMHAHTDNVLLCNIEEKNYKLKNSFQQTNIFSCVIKST